MFHPVFVEDKPHIYGLTPGQHCLGTIHAQVAQLAPEVLKGSLYH